MSSKRETEIESAEYVPHGPIRTATVLNPERGKPKRPKENLEVRAEAGDEQAKKELAALSDGVAAAHLANAAKATGAFNTSQKAPPLNGKHTNGVSNALTDVTEDVLASMAKEVPPKLVDDIVAAAGGKLTVENVRGLIVQECRDLEALLLEKNAGYGNSALDPVRLFSKAGPIEQLLVRIDDKISRIARGDFTKVRDEDLKVVTKDLLGYLILIRVAWRLGLA